MAKFEHKVALLGALKATNPGIGVTAPAKSVTNYEPSLEDSEISVEVCCRMSRYSDTRLLFRARPRYWLPTVVFIIFWYLLCVLGLDYLIPGKGGWIGLVVWLLSAAGIYFADLRPMLRARIAVDERGLTVWVDRGIAEIYWSEIIGATILRDDLQRPYLWILLRQREVYIPLRYLDAQRIWEQVQNHLNPEYLGDEVYEKWIAEQETALVEAVEQEGAEVIPHMSLPLRVHQVGWVKIVGWMGIVLFGGCTILSLVFAGPDLCTLPIFALFTVLSVLMVLPEIVEIDEEKIARIIPPFGRYQMFWKEIERMDYTPGLDWLVFYGNNKRLGLIGPSMWTGKDAGVAQVLLGIQLQRHRIKARATPKAYFIFSKNARVKR